MAKVIYLHKESNPLLRAHKARIENKSNFKKEKRTFCMDDLEDLDMNRNGTHTAMYLSRSIDRWIETFGPFCEIKLANAIGNTVISYNCITDITGNPIDGTFGKHPEFYRGWLKGQSGAQLSACAYNFSRQGTRKEARNWVEGYLYGCEYLAEGENQQVDPRTYPYQAGAIKAFQDVDSNRVVNIKERLKEKEKISAETLKDELQNAGYFELLHAIYLLWPRGMDI